MLAFFKKWFPKASPPPPEPEVVAPEKLSLDELVAKNLLLGQEIDNLRAQRIDLKSKIETLIHNRDSKKEL